MAMFGDFEPVQWLCDFLSIITIASCLVAKVPQILMLFKVGHADGMNLVGLLMELSSYTIMMSYNYRNNYALLSYMEYPIILVQELVLILVVVYFKRMLNFYSVVGAGTYFSITFAFLSGILPRELLTYLVPLCTPVGASSKVVQLVEILRHKNSESVSILTWFISAFTNCTRIFTIFMDSADLSLLLNFSVNTVLSSSIMAAAYFYKSPSIKSKTL